MKTFITKAEDGSVTVTCATENLGAHFSFRHYDYDEYDPMASSVVLDIPSQHVAAEDLMAIASALSTIAIGMGSGNLKTLVPKEGA